MIQENEIRAQLALLESGELPLWAFHEWIEETSFNMHRDSSPGAIDLVGSVGLLFADYDLRLIDESRLRRKLINLLHPIQFFTHSPNVLEVALAPKTPPAVWALRGSLKERFQPTLQYA